jgi:chemotaxis protein MotA
VPGERARFDASDGERRAAATGKSLPAGRQVFAGGEGTGVFDSALRMFDPLALLLVAGGSLLLAGFRATGGDVGRAFRALRPLLRANPARDELDARRAVRRIERIASTKGVACADRAESESRFVRRAALNICDAPSADAFAAWAAEELDGRRARHGGAIALWRAAADTAPSMGMIGTVIGLVGMFAAMDDPARMGPAMALAMLTTLYGLVLGTLVFGAIAARLERLSDAELRWQAAVLARIERLARSEAGGAELWLKHSARTGG